MIFQHDNYKEFIRAWIESQPSKGRGVIAKIANHLHVSPPLVSTILNSNRQLSLEQGCDLVDFFNLDSLEGEYFLALLSYEKAGSEKLRNHWNHQKKMILRHASEVKSRIHVDRVLSAEQQMQYYSHVMYGYVRVLCTLNGGMTLKELENALKVPQGQMKAVIQFLLEAQLIQHKNGSYFATEKVVHVLKDSPHFVRNHTNWRLQQLHMLPVSSGDDLVYTSACTISKKDFKTIRDLLVRAIAESHKIIQESPAENLACLTIDFIAHYSR